jgi:hypothetical protein
MTWGGRRRSAGFQLGACCLALLCAGCGVAAYEQRLADSNELFAYRNKLDAHLSNATWAAPNEYGVTMRIPKQLALIPPPAPPEVDENGEVVGEIQPDLRQPIYMGIQDMPGLIEAWRADLPTSDGGTAVAFLYALGNHERFLIRAANDGQGPDPAEYFLDLENLLQTTFGVSIPEGATNEGAQDNVRYNETIPRIERFAVPKEFSAVSILPPPEVIQQLGLPPLRVQLYEHTDGPIQLAFLMVYPVSVRENPVDSLRIALETLTVVPEPPRLRRTDQPESGGATAF